MWTAFPPVAIMLWGIAKPEKMMDFQAQAFRPSEDHGFKLVPDAPIVVSHLDTSSTLPAKSSVSSNMASFTAHSGWGCCA